MHYLSALTISAIVQRVFSGAGSHTENVSAVSLSLTQLSFQLHVSV